MLLEALVGMLIFSIGILAMIGMQAVSIKNTAAATYRSEASYLANQVLSMMWADQANLGSYSLNAGNNGCTSGAVGAAGNANLAAWLQNDVARLPGAAASGVAGWQQQIVIGAGNTVTVTMCWKSPGETLMDAANNPTAHNFVATAQIN